MTPPDPAGCSHHDAAAIRTIRDILDRVGDTWSILVVRSLRHGPMRFNELKRGLQVSQRMLTRTVRGLERDGIVERVVTPTKPPQVSYALTALGQSLLEQVSGLAQWVETARADIEAARARFDASA